MYEGELWLEIMLVDGINDDEQSILKFRELLKELKLDIPFSLKISTAPPPIPPEIITFTSLS